MFHYGMTKEQVGKCSLPFIYAILNEELARRICESLGYSYDKLKEESNEDEESVTKELNKKTNNEPYPLNNELNKQHYKNNQTKKDVSSLGKTTYDASSKDDIISFFSGMATFE